MIKRICKKCHLPIKVTKIKVKTVCQCKKCKHCNSTQHYSLVCYKKPRKPIRKIKRLKKLGPVALKWAETRNKWIQENANKDNKWECYLKISPYCLRELTIETLTLDHVLPRGSNPELRFELSNLMPSCKPCNGLKGSRKLDNIRKPFDNEKT